MTSLPSPMLYRCCLSLVRMECFVSPIVFITSGASDDVDDVNGVE